MRLIISCLCFLNVTDCMALLAAAGNRWLIQIGHFETVLLKGPCKKVQADLSDRNEQWWSSCLVRVGDGRQDGIETHADGNLPVWLTARTRKRDRRLF